MKGVVLAGGLGTRMNPITFSISKHLLPIYNKPMLYYPISVLMLSNIRDILIIIKSEDYKMYYNLLGNGKDLGIKISYSYQNKPNGIANGLIKCEKFVKNEKFIFILADNIFWGDGLQQIIIRESKRKVPATLFTYSVSNPNNFAVLAKNKKNIIEKPKRYIGNEIVTGLYIYDKEVFKIAKKIKPSKRNELEISDINSYFLKNNRINIVKLGRGIIWYDAGTFDDLMKVSNLVESIENKQGYMIACLEEIALSKKWISIKFLKKNLIKLDNSYSNYLLKLIK